MDGIVPVVGGAPRELEAYEKFRVVDVKVEDGVLNVGIEHNRVDEGTLQAFWHNGLSGMENVHLGFEAAPIKVGELKVERFRINLEGCEKVRLVWRERMAEVPARDFRTIADNWEKQKPGPKKVFVKRGFRPDPDELVSIWKTMTTNDQIEAIEHWSKREWRVLPQGSATRLAAYKTRAMMVNMADGVNRSCPFSVPQELTPWFSKHWESLEMKDKEAFLKGGFVPELTELLSVWDQLKEKPDLSDYAADEMLALVAEGRQIPLEWHQHMVNIHFLQPEWMLHFQ